MRQLTAFLLRHRLAVSAVFVLLGVASAVSLRSLRFDLSLEPILVTSDEERERLDAFESDVPARLFALIVTLTRPELVTSADLDREAEWIRELEDDPVVTSIFALATTRVVAGTEGVPRLELVRMEAADEPVLPLVERHPLLARRLLSGDGRTTALFVRVAPEAADDPNGLFIAPILDFFEARAGAGVQVRGLGGSVVQRFISRTMWRDMLSSVLLELVAFAVLLPLLFRTVRGSVLPLVVVYTAILLGLGLLTALGYAVSIIDIAVPGLIFIIGLCDAVHMIERFEESMRAGRSRDDAILEMMERVGVACLQTSITTGIGFLSLVTSRHVAVQAFGLKATVAVLITFVTVIALLPILLSIWPIRRRGREEFPFFRRLGLLPGRTVAIAFGSLVVACAFGVARVEVDSHWLEELPTDAPEVLDIAWFEERFVGVQRFDVWLDGDLASPATVAAIEEFQRRFLREPGVTGVESYTDWIREAAGAPASLTPRLVETGVMRLRLTSDLFPSHAVDREFERARISFTTADIGTRRFLELKTIAERELEKLDGPFRGEVAGYMVSAHESSRLVVTTMLESFLVSLIAISLFIAFSYRSLRIGLISVVPNVIPILVALALNGWLDIPIRIGIVMIYSLGLGLAVDDTIHLVTRFVQERRDRPDASPRECMHRSLERAGRALVVTSLILVVGCLCYLRAEFRSMTDVGILLSAVVVTALAADLFLLPHLLLLATPKGRAPAEPAPELDRGPS